MTNTDAHFEPYSRVEVSKSAILHNFDYFADYTGQSTFPVLRSNAYGHGIAQVASALNERDQVEYIVVDSYQEAVQVREVSQHPVLILGSIRPSNFKHLTYSDFAFCVQDVETVTALGETGKKVNVHLETNTDMNRSGVNAGEIPTIVSAIRSYKNLTLEGVMSHIARSTGVSALAVNNTVEIFDGQVEAIKKAGADPRYIHIAKTAATLVAKSAYANSVRIGDGLYGINPFPYANPLHQVLEVLRPAMKFISTITLTREIDKGDAVGYGSGFVAPMDMSIGILPIGIYDGINPQLGNEGYVKFGDTFLSIIGKICLNHTMIAIEGSLAQKGDEVIVFSDNPSDRNSLENTAKNLNSALPILPPSPNVKHVLVA